MDKDRINDAAYTVMKASFGSIPLVGAAASEILSLIVASPLEKRRNKWMEDVGERLKQLEETHQIDLEELQSNDQFIDMVLETSQRVLATSEQEKIEYFKNILTNSALGFSISEEKDKVFLNILNNFSTLHIKLLQLFDNPTSHGHGFHGSFFQIIESSIPALKRQRDLVNSLCKQLHDYSLINMSSIETSMTQYGLYQSHTSSLGKEFLSFISKN